MSAILFVGKDLVKFGMKFTTTNRFVADVLVHFKEMYNFSSGFKILVTPITVTTLTTRIMISPVKTQQIYSVIFN